MPVLETLGGALFGAVLQVLFDKLDSHQVLHYFRGTNLDEKQLKSLKRKLMDINAVIDDAEQKQFSNSLVKEWLDEVRDVLYDAEDLLDEIDYELFINKSEAQFQSSTSKVCNFESKMIQVLEDLESLSNQKVVQDFKISSGVISGLGNKVSAKNESSSLVAEDDVIFGRDEEKEMVLSWLTSYNNNKLSILSVVGMGGMGKTTLAQHVYNDPKIKEAQFDEKAWICISDEFNVFNLTRAILEAIQKSTDDSRKLDMVQGRLKEKLSGRKFLLVLDDVWNEDRDQWKALQAPLRCGAKGSKILVTTRSNKVALTLESDNILQLRQLQEDHSWQVFAKHAVQNDNSKLNSELKEIGMRIVGKCKGLPLALETLGCLLQSKSSISEWEGVLESNIWDFSIKDSKIIPALLLSYYHLPSPLKRCFSYCALFPKDYEFDKESLILLWMAQNFLQCSQQSKSSEEIGEQYFNDLLSRSFFQQVIRNNKTCFVMHDLINDLAKYVCGKTCYRLGVDRTERVSKTTRHLSILKDPVEYHEYQSLSYAKRLRTFMPICRNYEMSIQEVISKFKLLRVLSLSYCRNIKEVPDTLGDLIHLRSLDLSGTQIKKLPNSTCSLCNLQVLKLNKCFCLKELPSTLHELTNLCRLELMETTLKKIPLLLGKLKNLQVWMGGFEVGSNESSIQQLGELDLHGKLSIINLQNIVNPCDALTADLKNKTHLVGLCLNWNFGWNSDDINSIKEREVLENLQPSKHLEDLSLIVYSGTQFPRWLSYNYLSNVVSLTLKRCKYCQWLPSLGLFTFLKHLNIDGLDQIVRIDADFYGNSSSTFESLEMLEISNMREWEEWYCMTGAFPRLQRLSVTKCAKLKGHLPKHLSHLRQLIIHDCKQLVASIPSAVEIEGVKMEPSSFDMIEHLISDTPLNYLSIVSCPSLNILINHCYHFLLVLVISQCGHSFTNFPLDLFPKLWKLQLDKCCNLQMISQGHPHNHLKSLKIERCSEFESFPNEGLFAPQLETFRIEGSDKWNSMPKNMSVLLPSLNHLYIANCPVLEWSDGCLPSNLKAMRLFNCFKLLASLKGAWGTNPSLEFLYIGKVDVEFFSGEGLLPLSLTELIISDCPNLKKLDYRGLCLLSSLEKLHLYNCPILQCLPEEGLPKSISELRIRNCSLLKQCCKNQKGEDWEKIAHIKYIEVDYEKVNIEDKAQVGNY